MSTLSFYYGYWDYWKLYHKVTFDGINKLIIVNDGVTTLDVQSEVYSAWKQWAIQETNLKYLNPISTVGGEPTIEGQRLDVTYFLINGWKIKPYQGTYDLTLVGNIFDVDGGTIKVPADVNPFNPNNITINTNTSVIVRQVDSGTSGSISGPVTASLVTEQQDALYNIEGKVLAIYNGSTAVSASLVTDQLITLNNIDTKLTEIWKLHGLDINQPLTVTQTARTFDDIVQSISTTGSGSAQQTTIIRL